MTYYTSGARVKTELGTIPEDMLELAFEILMEQAELMKGMAQIFAPVETGALRDSIRIERGGVRQNWRTVRVRAGGYVVNPKTGRLVDYAAYVENKEQFMRRAYEYVKGNIEDLMKQVITHRINNKLSLLYTICNKEKWQLSTR